MLDTGESSLTVLEDKRQGDSHWPELALGLLMLRTLVGYQGVASSFCITAQAASGSGHL